MAKKLNKKSAAILLFIILIAAIIFINSKDKPLFGGDFTLTSQNNEKVSLSDYKGKKKLLFFGFSHCPSICPTALSNITAALSILAEDAGDIQPIFVTVDPQNDTPEVLANYIKNFDPSFVALTGSSQEIDDAKLKFRVYSQFVEKEGDDFDINHSSIIYFLDEDGNYISHFTQETSPAEMAEQIRQYL